MQELSGNALTSESPTKESTSVDNVTLVGHYEIGGVKDDRPGLEFRVIDCACGSSFSGNIATEVRAVFDAHLAAAPIVHFEASFLLPKDGNPAESHCSCGEVRKAPTLARAFELLAAHVAQATAKHPAWCDPGHCKHDPVGSGFTHYSYPYYLPGDELAGTSDRVRIQVWQPSDRGDETPERVTFVEMKFVDHEGAELYLIDFTMEQFTALRTLFGVIAPAEDELSADSAAFWLGVESTHEAAVNAIDFAAKMASLHLSSHRRRLRAESAAAQAEAAEAYAEHVAPLQSAAEATGEVAK